MTKYILGKDDEDKTRLCHICGIYYKVNPETNKIELFTLGYSSRIKDFIIIPRVNLPKKFINRFNDVTLTDKVEEELNDIGIHSYKSIKHILDRYAYYSYLISYEEYLKSPHIAEANRIYNDLISLQESINDYKSKTVIQKNNKFLQK